MLECEAGPCDKPPTRPARWRSMTMRLASSVDRPRQEHGRLATIRLSPAGRLGAPTVVQSGLRSPGGHGAHIPSTASPRLARLETFALVIIAQAPRSVNCSLHGSTRGALDTPQGVCYAQFCNRSQARCLTRHVSRREPWPPPRCPTPTRAYASPASSGLARRRLTRRASLPCNRERLPDAPFARHPDTRGAHHHPCRSALGWLGGETRQSSRVGGPRCRTDAQRSRPAQPCCFTVQSHAARTDGGGRRERGSKPGRRLALAG